MKRGLLILFYLLLPFVVCSQELVPKENEEGKWGLADQTGTYIGQGYVYDAISTFGTEGYFKVFYGQKWRLLDAKANEIPASAYDWIYPLYQGLSVVVQNGKYGIIDGKGKVLLKTEYDQINIQDKGLVMCQTWNKEKTSLSWVLYDSKNNKLTNLPSSHNIKYRAFLNGYSLVSESPKQHYFINKEGTKCSPDYEWVGERSEGYYVVKKDGKLGVVDSLTNIKLPCEYEEGGNVIGEGLWNTMKDDEWGFLDVNGQEVIPFEYEFTRPFYKGHAYIGDLVNGAVCFGLIDRNSQLVVPIRWSNILYTVDKNGQMPAVWVTADSLYSRLDVKTNEMKYPKKFNEVLFDNDGNSVVRSGKYWGSVDFQGNMIIPMRMTRQQTVFDVLKTMKRDGISKLSDSEAYRMNIRHSPERNNLMLSDMIPDYLWDY